MKTPRSRCRHTTRRAVSAPGFPERGACPSRLVTQRLVFCIHIRNHLMQGAIRMSTLPRVISLFSGLGALGCARVHVVPAPSAVQSVAPEDAPLSPYEAPRPRAESMNTEYYLGSEVDEAAGIKSFAEPSQAIQNHQSASQDQPVQRGARRLARVGSLLQRRWVEAGGSHAGRTRHGRQAHGRAR